MQGIQLARAPAQLTILKDRLIWLPSKSGSYSSKQGYELLKTQTLHPPVYEDTTKKALGIHGALLTAAWFHTRIRDINPVSLLSYYCPVSRATWIRDINQAENLMHLFYYCLVSRATWQAAGLTINLDDLPLDFTKTSLTVMETMDERQTVSFCNLLWEIWKARNREIFEGKKTQRLGILKQAKSMEQAVTAASSNLTRTQAVLNRIPRGAKTILVDASWEPSNNTGTGVMVFDEQGGAARGAEPSYGYQ